MRTLTRTQLGADLAVAAAFFLATIVVAYSTGNWFTADAGGTVPVVVLMSAALGIRRLLPAGSLGLAWVAAATQMTTRMPVSLFDFGICAVLYATAAYGDRILRAVGIASAVVGAFVATTYLVVTGQFFAVWSFARPSSRDITYTLILLTALLALLVLSWVTGLLAHTARLGRETLRREEIVTHERDLADYQLVVEQERNRIARDMHDVVAHSLAVVIAQADGARFAAAAHPEAAAGALETIAGVARGALGDVRMLLAELRHDEGDTPQPTVAEIDGLVEQVRGAGLAVGSHEVGERVPLGPGQEIAAYRIVQEALTNALRHGDTAEPVALTLLWDGEGVWIDVINALPAEADTPRVGVGHGIPGMRERAQLAGGAFFADAGDDGSYRVRARIPRASAP